MPRRGTDAVARRVAVLAVGAALLTMVGPLTPGLNGGTVAWSETQRISDGATATAPDRVLVGGKIEVNGKNWTMPAGGGSVIAVKL
ncbi:MAG: hypothetical protein L0H24_11405, partial [Microlunatus sp.]|nr:hypothetical protein [Microlunatus sp.]